MNAAHTEPGSTDALRPAPGAGTDTRADDTDVVSALCRTANRLRQHLEHTVLHPAGLNWTTYDVLHLVVTHRVVDTRTVALTNGISKSTVTVAARTLTTRDLIRRTADRDDQRHVWLRPTTTGWQILHELRPRITAEQQRLLDGRVPSFDDPALLVLRHLATQHTDGSTPGPVDTDFPE